MSLLLTLFDRADESPVWSLLGEEQTFGQSAQNDANDPTETWATKDFCSAKALFIPLR
jgi:hypothetical protein